MQFANMQRSFSRPKFLCFLPSFITFLLKTHLTILFSSTQSSAFGVVECILRQGSTLSLGVSSALPHLFFLLPILKQERKIAIEESITHILQVQQFDHSNSRNGRFHFCNCGSFTNYGNTKRIPTRLEAPLGGVSEQILCWRWIQIFPFLLFVASGGG